MSADIFKPEPSFVFQPPFAPAHEDEAMCVCVHCGETANANYRVSSYPHRFIPKKWEIEGFSRGLRCWTCSTSARSDFAHYRNCVVWFSPEHAHVTSEPVETDTMGIKYPAKQVVQGNPRVESAPAEYVSAPVDGGHSEVPVDTHDRLLRIRDSLDNLFFTLPDVPHAIECRATIGNMLTRCIRPSLTVSDYALNRHSSGPSSAASTLLPAATTCAARSFGGWQQA